MITEIATQHLYGYVGVMALILGLILLLTKHCNLCGGPMLKKNGINCKKCRKFLNDLRDEARRDFYGDAS